MIEGRSAGRGIGRWWSGGSGGGRGGLVWGGPVFGSEAGNVEADEFVED